MWIDNQILKRCHERIAIRVWIPEESVVVLGSANKIDTEVHEQACTEDGVAILKRAGGGGTVLLHPGCIILSLGTWVQEQFQNSKYFKLLNDSVIGSLASASEKFSGLEQRGISDICHNNRKIVGTSLFRSRNYLLYQASILYNAEIASITRYLKHPSREPDYRQGRSHSDFLTGLRDLDNGTDILGVSSHLEDNLPDRLRNLMVADLIDPVEGQFANLLKRASAG